MVTQVVYNASHTPAQPRQQPRGREAHRGRGWRVVGAVMAVNGAGGMGGGGRAGSLDGKGSLKALNRARAAAPQTDCRPDSLSPLNFSSGPEPGSCSGSSAAHVHRVPRRRRASSAAAGAHNAARRQSCCSSGGGTALAGGDAKVLRAGSRLVC